MIRRLTVVFFISILSLGLVSCQSYSTGLQHSVARANETLAITSLKAVSSAQQAYALANNGNYGTFQQLCDGGYLDSRFNSAKPEFKDYVLSMDVAANFYSVNADPTAEGQTAGRHFYMDATSPLLHVNPTQAATASDPVLQP